MDLTVCAFVSVLAQCGSAPNSAATAGKVGYGQDLFYGGGKYSVDQTGSPLFFLPSFINGTIATIIPYHPSSLSYPSYTPT